MKKIIICILTIYSAMMFAQSNSNLKNLEIKRLSLDYAGEIFHTDSFTIIEGQQECWVIGNYEDWRESLEFVLEYSLKNNKKYSTNSPQPGECIPGLIVIDFEDDSISEQQKEIVRLQVNDKHYSSSNGLPIYGNVNKSIFAFGPEREKRSPLLRFERILR